MFSWEYCHHSCKFKTIGRRTCVVYAMLCYAISICLLHFGTVPTVWYILLSSIFVTFNKLKQVFINPRTKVASQFCIEVPVPCQESKRCRIYVFGFWSCVFLLSVYWNVELSRPCLINCFIPIPVLRFAINLDNKSVVYSS